jgi:hypothetical protein
LFVEGLWAETVSAGQIKDTRIEVGGSAEKAAFFAFDGDAGVVTDFRAEAGEGVEKGCLAAIGIAGEDDVGGRSVKREA